ncbi:hypothetical protein X947_5086 [Burkholderia pseudomallei MSHR7334]|nr:hypothetical protein X947_5086 [Burkholderia pseudomallei MSHR7334]
MTSPRAVYGTTWFPGGLRRKSKPAIFSPLGTAMPYVQSPVQFSCNETRKL